jgi:hypothetical protein
MTTPFDVFGGEPGACPKAGDRVLYQGGESLWITSISTIASDVRMGVTAYLVARLVTASGFVRVPAMDLRRLAWDGHERVWRVKAITDKGFGG